MRTILAIVCSLLLTGAPVLAKATSAACVGRAVQTTCYCGKACCAAPASPEPQPVPAAPTSTSTQDEFLAMLPSALTWTLFEAPALEFSNDSAYSPLTVTRTPLFMRNCAFLI